MEYDSVKDIGMVCSEMCNVAKQYDKVVLYYASQKVEQSMHELEETFNAEKYDEKAVASKKKVVEQDALQLESVLAKYIPEYRERYELRCSIINKYKEVGKQVQQAFDLNDSVLLGRLLADMHTLKEFVLRVGHIKFEMSQDDMECFKILGNVYERVQ